MLFNLKPNTYTLLQFMHVYKQACEYAQETTLIHECLSFCKIQIDGKSQEFDNQSRSPTDHVHWKFPHA
jgi:hypothetical protein